MSTARFLALIRKKDEDTLIIVPDFNLCFKEEVVVYDEARFDYLEMLSGYLMVKNKGGRRQKKQNKDIRDLILDYWSYEDFVSKLVQDFIKSYPDIRVYPTEKNQWLIKENGEAYHWISFDVNLPKQFNWPKAISRGTSILNGVGIVHSAIMGYFVNVVTNINPTDAAVQIPDGAAVAFLTYYATNMEKNIKQIVQRFGTKLPDKVENQGVKDYKLDTDFEVIHFSNTIKISGLICFLAIGFNIYTTLSSTHTNFENNIETAYDQGIWPLVTRHLMNRETFVVLAQLAFAAQNALNFVLQPINFTLTAMEKRARALQKSLNVTAVSIPPADLKPPVPECHIEIASPSHPSADNKEAKDYPPPESASPLAQLSHFSPVSRRRLLDETDKAMEIPKPDRKCFCTIL